MTTVSESLSDAASSAATNGQERVSRRFDGVIRTVILVVAVLVPIAYLPLTPDPLAIKSVLLGSSALVLAVLWLARSLLLQRLSYRRMPLNAALIAAALTLIASTFGASAPWASTLLNDPTGEKSGTLLAMFVVAFVAAAVLESKDVRRIVGLLLLVFILLGVSVFVPVVAQAFGVSPPWWLAINPIGTPNARALVLAGGMTLGLTLALTAVTSQGRRVLTRRSKWVGALAALVGLAALLFTGFPALWYGLCAVFALALALSLAWAWRPPGARSDSCSRTGRS